MDIRYFQENTKLFMPQFSDFEETLAENPHFYSTDINRNIPELNFRIVSRNKYKRKRSNELFTETYYLKENVKIQICDRSKSNNNNKKKVLSIYNEYQYHTLYP